MSKLTMAVGPEDHVRGSKNPQFEIVEYGDFQCPYCGAAEPIVERMYQDFKNSISIVFRNFPLSEMHQMALPAAQAAEAAANQGKYWQMHDMIYANQEILSPEFLLLAAGKLKLDLSQFETDLNSTKVKNKIEKDFESGVMSGVNGTPSFFLNGTKFESGAPELYALLKLKIG